MNRLTPDANLRQKGYFCPYPAAKVDFCPHASMTYRSHRAVCGFAGAAFDNTAGESPCSSPCRTLGTPLDPNSSSR